MEGDILCNNRTEVCEQPYLSGFTVASNSASIVINFLHIIALCFLKTEKKTNFIWILVNIGFSDAVASLTYICMLSCHVNEGIYHLNYQHAANILKTTAVSAFAATAVRNGILALGSYERYVMICTPLVSETNRVIKKFPIFLGLVWIVSFVLGAILGVLPTIKVCVGRFGSYPENPLFANTIIICITLTVPAIIIGVCSFKVIREFQRMKPRNNTNADDAMKSAGKYIMLTCLLFYLSFIPSFAGIFTNAFDQVDPNVFSSILWTFLIGQSLYGAVNVFMYIYMVAGYRAHLKKLICCCKRHNNVAPN